MSDSSELVVYTTSNHDSYYLMDYYGRESLSVLTWPTISQARNYPTRGEKLFRITLTVEEIQ